MFKTSRADSLPSSALLLIAGLALGIVPGCGGGEVDEEDSVEEAVLATGNKLLHGQKLTPGHCLRSVDGFFNAHASLCLDGYAQLTLAYNGHVCEYTFAGNHTAAPGAYLTILSNGDVALYQYSGGRQLWHAKTGSFSGGHLEIYANFDREASLAITDSRNYVFTWASCH